jgi:hypothetical protein
VELYAVRERRGGPWDWARGLREQAGFGDHARFMDGLVIYNAGGQRGPIPLPRAE